VSCTPVSWRTDKRKTAERGYGWEWQKARAQYLIDNPLCVMCLPKIRLATVVDHKIPHKGDETLFWDRANWQALCKPHHDSTKARQENLGGAEIGGDVQGVPIDPNHHWNR
jgi:5-methylcytosine-specific restriction enzyme A